MSNYLVLAITVLTALPIVFGILLGLLRGSRRALLRLILILLCIVLAGVLCNSVTDAVVEVDISQVTGESESMTVTEFLEQSLGEDLAELGDYIVPIMQSLVKVIMFLLLFFLFWLVSWIIVYPICKLFVKPKKVTDDNGKTRKKRHRLVGAAIGLVQGVVVALCVCIVINGLFGVTGDLMQAADGLSSIQPPESEEVAMYAEGEESNDDVTSAIGDVNALFAEYKESALGKLYTKVGTKPFAFISSVKTKDDRTITLPGQVEALTGIVDIAKEFMKITELDFDNLYAEGNIQTLTEILNNIQAVKDGMSEEASGTVEGMLEVLGKSFEVDVKRFYNINFANEAEAFNKLSQYKDADFSSMSPDEIKAAATDIVKSVGKSELLLDILADQDIDIGHGLDDEQIDEINNALDKLVESDDLDAETVAKLREIFGLSYSGGAN